MNGKLDDRPVVLLGCGDIGTQLALSLQGQGRDVLAVRRDISALPAGIPALAIDYTDAAQAAALAGLEGSLFVMTPTPAARDEEGYRRGYLEAVDQLLRTWSTAPPAHLLFVSSTRVYGEAGGRWVDEDTPPNPDGYAGECIAASERRLLESPHGVTIVRFAGIYGRRPSPLLERVGRICAKTPVRYGNRIHRADCAGFLLHLLGALRRGEAIETVYLGVDDAPVDQWEVESWLARRLGAEPVEQALPGRGGNKRCRNDRLRASGYALRYPDYRSGYEALLGPGVTGP